MKKYVSIALGICILFFSCNSNMRNSGLMEIPVDIDQNSSLPLSEIAESITAIELELTDESPINPDRIRRVLVSKGNVIIAEQRKILVFGTDGKYIRSIGHVGQGPGEYVGVRNVALDEKKEHLYVNSMSKIICYDLSGNFLREASKFQPNASIVNMDYINDVLLIIAEQVGNKDTKGSFNHSAVYRLNEELQITDSCTIRDNYFERPGLYFHPYEDFISNKNTTVYLYYSDIYFNEQHPAEEVLRDTLYRLEDNRLVPDLKLKFKDNGIDGSGKKFIQLFNVYRSSRYIFAVYGNSANNNYFRFCYDTKTGKGYNMQNGYTDDINGIDARISIRPFNTDTEMFYYLHTNMKPDNEEEPNPTLYIGKVKK